MDTLTPQPGMKTPSPDGDRDNTSVSMDTGSAQAMHSCECQQETSAAALPKKPLGYRFVKRTFDLIFSTLVILVGFVPGLLLALIIYADTGGTPIYSQVRAGKAGKPFRILKFRSMVADSDNVEKYLSAEQLEQWNRERKVDDDPRITRLGRILRKTSIDEFPQFLNVFMGQISIIGPRAITFEELDFFGSDRDLLLSVPPGITGYWQTGARNRATFENGTRQQIELAYVLNANLMLDMKIFLKTFKTMILGNGK